MENPAPPKPTHQKKHNPYYWWRRFPSKQPLHHYTPLLKRIQNGDFEFSEYYHQARWEDQWCQDELNSLKVHITRMDSYTNEVTEVKRKYSKRKNLLLEDAYKDEKGKLNTIVKEFQITFGGTATEIAEFMTTFDGTLEEMYWAYGKVKGYKFPYDSNSLEIYTNLIDNPPKRKRGRPRKNP